jgi:hypothetical protein
MKLDFVGWGVTLTRACSLKHSIRLLQFMDGGFMPASKIKKSARQQSQVERTAANFEPLFKSLAAIKQTMGIAPTVIGAQLRAAHQTMADHRHSEAEKATSNFNKLTSSMDEARALLKNKKPWGRA